VTAAGRCQLAGRHDGQAGGHDEVQPVRGGLAFEVTAAAGGVAGHVVGHVDGVRVHLAGQRDHLGGRVTVPDHQVAAALPELLAQVGQGVGQETDPVRRPGDGRVDDEGRHHLPGPGARLVQRRVVVQAEIPGEQHDRGFHPPSLRRSLTLPMRGWDYAGSRGCGLG
jgi:hypothetical protein